MSVLAKDKHALLERKTVVHYTALNQSTSTIPIMQKQTGMIDGGREGESRDGKEQKGSEMLGWKSGEMR